MIEFHQLLAAYQTARRDLLAQREPSGHWVGEPSSSAFSTATAASALALVARHDTDDSRRSAYRQVADRGIAWLARCQSEDGGWGDTDKNLPNIATTLLVQAAFHLTGRAEQYAGALERTERFVQREGGVAGLWRRFGPDRAFVYPILANYALAGLVPWRQVPALPFEIACLPPALIRLFRLPAVTCALPGLVAVGLARFHHRRPRNPLTWLVRRLSIGRSLRRLEAVQPPVGGFLDAIPLTSFVVMALASIGRGDHPVARRGVGFLLDTVRPDGSWPIDSNMAVWNTTLAINALAASSGDVGALGSLDWLLASQQQQPHPLTQAAPGGWGWTNSAAAVPDVDDTSGALLALVVLANSGRMANRPRIEAAAAAALDWLLAVQNPDGGWPSFGRGRGYWPLDRSGCDMTAHALRALHVWRLAFAQRNVDEPIRRGLDYLAAQQKSDGRWSPLWFGNQNYADEENPVYGTARVLLAYRDLGLIESEPARRGLKWLAANIDSGGGWGGGRGGPASGTSSVEETALAVEALLAARNDPALQSVLNEGLQWLVKAVGQQRHRQAAPIGLCLAKLWYYERVYPLAFTVAALGQAIKHYTPGAVEEGTEPARP